MAGEGDFLIHTLPSYPDDIRSLMLLCLLLLLSGENRAASHWVPWPPARAAVPSVLPAVPANGLSSVLSDGAAGVRRARTQALRRWFLSTYPSPDFSLREPGIGV